MLITCIYSVKGPITYTKVLVSNWRALAEQNNAEKHGGDFHRGKTIQERGKLGSLHWTVNNRK